MSSINFQNLLEEGSHVKPNFATDSTKFNIAVILELCGIRYFKKPMK